MKPRHYQLGLTATLFFALSTSGYDVASGQVLAVEAGAQLLHEVAHQRRQEKTILSATGKADLAKQHDETRPVASPLPADETLGTFYLDDDYRIELVACEPLVIDPVAYDWGPDGKLWIVEMGDYPLGSDGQGKPGGRVRTLQDTTGDGNYDRSTLFAVNLAFPNGITVWRDGVIVTCAPQILYLADTNDDGQADVEQPLYTGLTEGNPQLRVNGLRWGLDGWLYCANGLSTVDEVQSAKTGQKLSLRGRDMRIRPDDGALDAQLGSTQFGRNRDDWGNWFGVSNSNPMWHYVLADQYLRRNPHVAPPSGRHDVSITPGKANVFSRSAKGIFFHESEVGRFTSANSTIVYRDELFDPEFSRSAFVSEPVHNLIHREVMQPAGVTFSSQRTSEEQQSEFLASTDTWFRPNMIRTGPDGALWIADMAREIIDHPQYIPADQHARLDFRNGDTLGRIYRIVPRAKVLRPVPDLTRLSGTELAELLESPNGTLRDMVQKQIVWGSRRDAVAVLQEQAISSPRATCRLQSLWTLECLHQLRPATVLQALDDRHAGVRRGAVRLVEGKFAEAPELGIKIGEMTGDVDLQVRLQLACTLGEWHDPRAAAALAQLGRQNTRQPLIVAAVLSSIGTDNVGPVLKTLLATGGDLPESLVGQLLVTAVGVGQNAVVADGLAAVATPLASGYASWQLGALVALSDKLWSQKKTLANVVRFDPPRTAAIAEKLDRLFESARALVGDSQGPEGERLRAVRLLGHQGQRGAEDLVRLGSLLTPQESVAIQTAAIECLARLGGDQVPPLLLANWSGHSPARRAQVIDVLIGRTDWTSRLLDKIEQGALASGELDASQRSKLVNHRHKALRQRAATLLADSSDGDRQAVLRLWQSALQLQGEFQPGAVLFAKHCHTCHQLDGQGHAVGPDLAALSDKRPDTFLLSIVDPSRAVDARFLNYVAVTDDGRSYAGILVQESAATITLQGADGKDEVLMRESLDVMQCSGKSMMPDGLEKDMTRQDMADLIAYLSGPRTRKLAPSP